MMLCYDVMQVRVPAGYIKMYMYVHDSITVLDAITRISVEKNINDCAEDGSIYCILYIVMTHCLLYIMSTTHSLLPIRS